MTSFSTLPRPARTTSKRLTWSSLVAAWGTLWLAMWQGAEMAAVIAPSMMGLIVIVVGAYMGVGHADMRATLAAVAGRAAPQPEAADTPKAP